MCEVRAIIMWCERPDFKSDGKERIRDYILAFAALGLSGFFAKSKNGLLKGYGIAILGRYFFAVLSGCLFSRVRRGRKCYTVLGLRFCRVSVDVRHALRTMRWRCSGMTRRSEEERHGEMEQACRCAGRRYHRSLMGVCRRFGNVAGWRH